MITPDSFWLTGADSYELQRAGQDDNLQAWQWFQGLYNATVA